MIRVLKRFCGFLYVRCKLGSVGSVSVSLRSRFIFLPPKEELEVSYEIKKYQRLPSLQAPPELLAVNPLGKAPVITDGEVNIAESGAVIEYLLRKYGKGKFAGPAEGTQAAIDDLYYLHYAEGTLMPILVQKFIFELIPQRAPWFLRWFLNIIFTRITALVVDPAIDRNVNMIESHLTGKEWLAGGSEPTAADFSMAFCMETIIQYRLGGTAIEAYVDRMQARPAYRRALKKGGEYAYAKL